MKKGMKYREREQLTQANPKAVARNPSGRSTYEDTYYVTIRGGTRGLSSSDRSKSGEDVAASQRRKISHRRSHSKERFVKEPLMQLSPRKTHSPVIVKQSRVHCLSLSDSIERNGITRRNSSSEMENKSDSRDQFRRLSAEDDEMYLKPGSYQNLVRSLYFLERVSNWNHLLIPVSFF
jgi:hypothetical protein